MTPKHPIGQALGISLLCIAFGFSHVSLAAEAAATDPAQLAVNSGRPVADAAAELTARYGYLITYEDPEFAYSDDIQDVTAEVRHDLAKYPPGRAHKVLVPSGGALTVNYEVLRPGGKPADSNAMIQRVLATQASTARGGVFRTEQTGELVHIVPAQVRDASGAWISQSSILDARITISDAPRTVSAMLDEICTAVSKGSKVRLAVGGGPSFYEETPPSRGAHDEVARDVLIRTLKSTGQQVLWQIFYAPDFKWKFLNLRIIRQGKVLDAAPPLQLPPPTSSDSGSFKGQR
jgi:hypothetical protein